jgi:arylsulfatase A-like enzyme
VLFTSDRGLCRGDRGRLRKSAPYRRSLEVPFQLSWPAGGFGSGGDGRLTGHVDSAPTFLAAAGLPPGTPHDGHSLLDRRNDRTHHSAEWWWQDRQPVHTWATYIGKTEQYAEYYRTRLGRVGRPSPGAPARCSSGSTTTSLRVPRPAKELAAARRANR